MKKLLFVCALASFAFVGCKCNKPAEAPVAEAEEVEVVAEEAEGEEVAEAEVVETPAEEVVAE